MCSLASVFVDTIKSIDQTSFSVEWRRSAIAPIEINTMVESGGIADANVLRQHFLEQSLGAPSSKRTGEHGQSIIIVGAGAFGSSLALELVTNYPDKYRPLNLSVNAKICFCRC